MARRGLLLLLLSMALVSAPAYAVPITYTESVIASGSLGGVPFTDALLTISLVSDTLNATRFRFNRGVATVDVDGIGTATFTSDDMRLVKSTTTFFNVPQLGISDFELHAGIMFTQSQSFGGYNLRGPIGPVSGPGNVNRFQSFPTTLGALAISSTLGDFTFVATTVGTPEPIPEPTSLTLVAAGLLAALGFRRYRLRA